MGPRLYTAINNYVSFVSVRVYNFFVSCGGTCKVRLDQVLIHVQKCGHGGTFQISFRVGHDVLALAAQAINTQFNHITRA